MTVAEFKHSHVYAAPSGYGPGVEIFLCDHKPGKPAEYVSLDHRLSPTAIVKQHPPLTNGKALRLGEYTQLLRYLDNLQETLVDSSLRKMTVEELRAQGFAVTLYSPEELDGIAPQDMEEHLGRAGSEFLDLHGRGI